jgi:septal ring factor EnvC (AmiA/AmiB activator)
VTYQSDPSYQDLLDTIDDQKSDIARLTRERDEWEANEQESYRDVVRLEARVDRLEGELRRLRDRQLRRRVLRRRAPNLVCEDDVTIIDEVLHG